MPCVRRPVHLASVLAVCLLPLGASAQERLALLWDAGPDAERLESALGQAGYRVEVFTPPSASGPEPEKPAEAVITLAPAEEADHNVIALLTIEPAAKDETEAGDDFEADATPEDDIEVAKDSAAPAKVLRPPGKGQTDSDKAGDAKGDETVALDKVPPPPVRTPLEKFTFDAGAADIVLIYARLDEGAEPGLEQLVHAAEPARRAGIVLTRICGDGPVPLDRDISMQGPGPIVVQATGCGAENAAQEEGGASDDPLATALIAALEESGQEAGIALRQLRAALPETPGLTGALPDLPVFLAARDGNKLIRPRDPRAAWAALDADTFAPIAALAEEEEDPRALLARAFTRLDTTDPRYDPAAAAGDLRAASAGGSATAAYELGRLFETGVGVPRHIPRAVALYEQAASRGHGAAASDLGFLHMEGELGLTADTETAQRFFRQAADLGHPQAMFSVATMIGEDAATETDPEEAAAYVYRGLRQGTGSIFDLVREDPRILRRTVRLALQRLLAADGLYDGAIDGAVGPQTKQAIRLAQGLEE